MPPLTRPALVLALTLACSTAHAQDVPGALTNASGLTASAPGGIILRALPVWRGADGTIVALSEDPGIHPIYDRLGTYLGAVPPPPSVGTTGPSRPPSTAS